MTYFLTDLSNCTQSCGEMCKWLFVGLDGHFGQDYTFPRYGKNGGGGLRGFTITSDCTETM